MASIHDPTVTSSLLNILKLKRFKKNESTKNNQVIQQPIKIYGLKRKDNMDVCDTGHGMWRLQMSMCCLWQTTWMFVNIENNFIDCIPYI